MKKIAAAKNYRMLKLAENAVLSNNRITMIRISILSMGIKEILGFMGIVGAAFGLGKWGGWIKDKWNSLTGKEKEDAGDQELVQNLIASLSAEELEDLYHEILAHREIEELVNSESIAPKGVDSRLKSVMEEISDKFEAEIIKNDHEESPVLDEKKIASDKNYRMIKKAFAGKDMWTLFSAPIGSYYGINDHGCFSSLESAVASLREVFNKAKLKGYEIREEREGGGDSHIKYILSRTYLGGEYTDGIEFHINKEPLSDGKVLEAWKFVLKDEEEFKKQREEESF